MVLQEASNEGVYQRKASMALESWKTGASLEESRGRKSSFALSANASSVDLKEFLSKRGELH